MESLVRELAIPVQGAVLRGVVVGAGKAPPVVTLHSGPGESHDLLRPWLDPLAESQRRLVYYDQRGSGRSALAPGAPFGDWRTHVEDLHAVLSHEGSLNAPLLGHSWGGLLALLYALDHRSTVGPLILIAPSPVRASDGNQFREGEAAALKRPEVIAAQEQYRREGAVFAAHVAPWLGDPKLAAGMTPPFRNDAAGRAVRNSLAKLDLSPRLGELKGLPIVIVHGERDPLPSMLSEETARLTGADFVPIPELGHVPFFEAPNVFRAIVLPFLQRHG